MSDPLLIGLRAQDFHESLRNHSAFGPKEVHFKKTLLVGKAASLAMHLRGLIYIDDFQQLEYAAASLGISSLELRPVLQELEELDFVSIIKSGEKIKRVDIRVPAFRSGYQDLGERWEQLKPSVIEQASIETVNDLHQEPRPKLPYLEALGLESTEQAIMMDVTESGLLVATQTVDGEPTLYTPLAVDGNPTLYLEWASRFPGEVPKVIDVLRGYQGLPLGDKKIQDNDALNDAILTGVLMPVEINGSTGSQRFVFAPHGGLSPDERVVMDKARAILASVRYGQNFAKGRPIKYPSLILKTLRNNKRFSKGHPDLFSQYGLLAEKLIGHPFEEKEGFWNFKIDDTEENIKALDIAIEMVEHGETPSSRLNIDAQKALLGSSGFQGPPTVRPALSKHIQGSPETRNEIIRQMGEIMRGGYTK